MLLQDAPWAILRERAVHAEAMGFDSVWVADHLAEPYRPGSSWGEAWTLLGALATSTSRVTIGALASSQSLREPVLLARAAGTLRDISGGRAELAVGAGGAPLDHAMVGAVAWTAAERAERFSRFVPAVSALLKTGRRLADADDSPGFPLDPHGGIRLTVAALGPRSIELAARYGDAWNSYGVRTGARVTGRLTHAEALALFRARADRLARACADAGRDPGEVTRSYTWVDSYLDPVLVDLPACVEVARDYRAAGVDEFIVYWPSEASLEAELAKFALELARL